MPSKSLAQHRFIEWVAHDSAAQKKTGLSQTKASEWAHADKGRPWKRASGGDVYDSDKPQISREDDAEILSRGRQQSRSLDLNLSPPPEIRAPLGPIDSRPSPAWLPGPIPNDVIKPPSNRQRAQSGGGIGVHRDIGGGVLDPSNGPTGLAPTAQNQNPMQQNALQSYSQETPEKLQETLARLGGPATPQGALVARVLKQKQMAPQPVGQFRRGGAMKRADGGDMGVSPSQGSPWWTRAEARSGAGGGGFLHGTTAGRADKVETSAPGGSYVLPADIIAGLGEGNGLAGARVTQEQLSTGPRGIPLPRSGGGRGMPRPPPALREAKGGTIPIFPERAAGGVSGKSETPVLLSHGEFVLTPDECVRIGRGLHKFFMTPAGEKILRADRMKGLLAAMDSEADKKRGHRILDAFVVHKRGEQVKKIAKLPPPVKA